MADEVQVARHLPGLTLRDPHPLAGREAYQCVTCSGIFYPVLLADIACPYCAEDEDDDA